MAKSGKLWIGIYAACCSALPFACSFISMLPRVALEYGQIVCALAMSFGLRLLDVERIGSTNHHPKAPLKRAIGLDKQFQKLGIDDEDLRPLRERIVNLT